MNKTVRVLMPTEIPEITDYVDDKTITEKLNCYLKHISDKINVKDLGDWRLLILINSRATSGVGIYKRVRRYLSDQEFEISISICIPNEEQVSYGLVEVKESFYHPLNDMNFYILDPCFENYDSLFEYILECSKHAIDLGFTKGFNCNGKKIKFQ